MSAEKMMQAYRMLFEIEYNLREEIRARMIRTYMKGLGIPLTYNPDTNHELVVSPQ
jgi:hypothetical protein